jgi:hypothetical protein
MSSTMMILRFVLFFRAFDVSLARAVRFGSRHQRVSRRKRVPEIPGARGEKRDGVPRF